MSPIDCNQVLRDIESYLDGELRGGGDAEAAMETHLSRCGPCMDRSEFRKQLRELLAKSCACDEVPARLRERVEALLNDQSEPSA